MSDVLTVQEIEARYESEWILWKTRKSRRSWKS